MHLSELTDNQLMRLANFRQIKVLHIERSLQNIILSIPENEEEKNEEEKFERVCNDLYQLTGIQGVVLPATQGTTKNSTALNFLHLNLTHGTSTRYSIAGKPYLAAEALDRVEVYILAQKIALLSENERYRLFTLIAGTSAKPAKGSLFTVNFFSGESSFCSVKTLPNFSANQEVGSLYRCYQKLTFAERNELGKYYPPLEPEALMLERMQQSSRLVN